MPLLYVFALSLSLSPRPLISAASDGCFAVSLGEVGHELRYSFLRGLGMLRLLRVGS
jgi:hypothetical protein